MENNQRFWEKTAEETMAVFKVNKDGLSKSEVHKRILKFGKNEIAAEKKRSVIGIFLSQFKSPLVLLLLAASLVAGFLGDAISTIIIVLMVLISAVLAFFQEYKSERAINELRRKVALKAVVLRDGKLETVDAALLVPGDIVYLDLGKVVPADLRLIFIDDLLIDESILTGESFPVEKSIEPLAGVEYLPQAMKNFAFSGTHIVQGSGKGVVIATGKQTELGRTANLLQAKPAETEFQKGIKDFGMFLVKVILFFTLFIFLFLAIFKGQWLQSLLFALAIAVGISPELLPIIITINLSRGAQKMSKKQVIVKRLMSIEDLGNVDVLCTDKTGTLTQGKIVLKDYSDLSEKKNAEVLKYALLCNSLTVVQDGIGNPLDRAIIECRQSEKLKNEVKGYKIIDDLAFDFKRRRMSVIVAKEGKTWLISKGAVDEVLSICRYAKINGHLKSKTDILKLKEKFLQYEKKGLRLLLLAMKEIEKKNRYDVSDEKNLELVGFLIFADEPKDTVKEALETFKNLGVEIKILTGDSSPIAVHLCEQIGFKVAGLKQGSELESLTDEEFSKAVVETNVFTKITPEHKLKIVNTLKQAKHTVGFLGDGVNDAPALRAADVGVSVDSAVDVAKEAADVILLRKSMRVLADGIKEGRRTFGNTLKYIFSTISSNYGNMLSVAGAALILPYIPMLPTQILLLNFLSDFPMLAVSTDQVDRDYLKKPKHWDMKVISRFMVSFGLASSLFDFMTFGVLLLVFRASSSLFQTGWFWESFLTEVIIIFVIRTRKWFWQSRASRILILTSVTTTLIVLLFIYTRLGSYFNLTPLPAKVFLSLIGISGLYFVMVELGKRIFYKKYGA